MPHGIRQEYPWGEMSDAEHEELLRALKNHRGMVLLSGYDCGMYRDMLPDWRVQRRAATADRGKRRTECLWMNPVVVEAGGGQTRISDLEGL